MKSVAAVGPITVRATVVFANADVRTETFPTHKQAALWALEFDALSNSTDGSAPSFVFISDQTRARKYGEKRPPCYTMPWLRKHAASIVN